MLGIGGSAVAGKEALDAWLRRYPLLPDQTVKQWISDDQRVWCHWVSHGEDQLGGIRYTATAPGTFALFAGRPVRWQDGEANGRDSIDPRGYLEDPGGWAPELDGRYCVVRADDRHVHVVTDPVGLLPVYTSRHDGAVLVSNMAALVTPGKAAQRIRALAGLLAAGWGMTGEPMPEGVDRITPGALVTLTRDGSSTERRLGPACRELFSAPPDYAEAERLMLSLARGFADWPGRPQLLALTGGRDSRVIGAALRHAGVTTSAVTVAFAGQVGYPATGDVLLASALATTFGIEHTIRTVGPQSALYSRLPSVLDVLRLTSPGTTALNDIMDLQLRTAEGPLPVMHDGVAGEIARGGFDTYLEGDTPRGGTPAEMADALLHRAVMKSPTPLVNADGMGLLRSWMREFVTSHVDEGVKLDDIPDTFFLYHQAAWHGPNVTNREHREDAVSMMLSPRLWPHMLGTTARERASGVFHREMLSRFAPEVANLPYEKAAASWTPGQGIKEPSDPIEAVLKATRIAVADHPDHPAWAVLDRRRVTALLDSPSQVIRGPGRYQLWSLATVFCGAS
ncbi:hypothetical protein [Nonomuraea sp. SBT364]|uniref:hypothetical protein n=1 Tax=Nonomuraea sp. SBT364 TaxID=1580530 RepID=UPI00066AA83F|nr:hypothetical protein [Nonomuraea sp. SBT364]